MAALEGAGQPVVRIALADPYDLGGEFFRWQFATAVAGPSSASTRSISRTSRPAKIAARKLHRRVRQDRRAGRPRRRCARATGSALYADARNAVRARSAARRWPSALGAHLRPGQGRRLRRPAPLPRDERGHRGRACRPSACAIRDRLKRRDLGGLRAALPALHGQAYKGGANTGVFLQITADDVADVPVPGPEVHASAW